MGCDDTERESNDTVPGLAGRNLSVTCPSPLAEDNAEGLPAWEVPTAFDPDSKLPHICYNLALLVEGEEENPIEGAAFLEAVLQVEDAFCRFLWETTRILDWGSRRPPMLVEEQGDIGVAPVEGASSNHHRSGNTTDDRTKLQLLLPYNASHYSLHTYEWLVLFAVCAGAEAVAALGWVLVRVAARAMKACSPCLRPTQLPRKLV